MIDYIFWFVFSQFLSWLVATS